MQRQPEKEKAAPRGWRRRLKARGLSAWQAVLGLVLLAMLVFGAARLIGYVKDLIAARNSVKDVRELYENAPTNAPTDNPTNAPAETAAPEPSASPSPAPTAAPTAAREQTPIPRLDPMPYPENESREISAKFKALRRENKDIVGWLTVPGQADEPVVQRDNVFYLTHDVSGADNVNGALFLDAGVNLKTRPYSLIIYGHNMKSGAMFGSLRNYENIAYYRRSPFLTFDSMYEEGRYVIFAVGTVNVEDEDSPRYLDFFDLYSTAVAGRERAIGTLIACSAHTCPVDVSIEDQLLLLVTCVGDDNVRRVVAARRVRDTETESGLQELAQKARKK